MRAVRISLIVLVVLAGLFIAADRVSLYIAQGEVATRARDGLDLSEEPDVSIKGFPFLTQVLGQELDRVTLGVERFDAQVDGLSMTVQDLDIELSDTKLSDGFTEAVAAEADGTGLLAYQEMTDAYGELIGSTSNGFGATFGFASKGLLKVNLHARMMGQSLTVGEVTGRPVLEGDRLRLEIVEEDIPDSIPGGEALVRSELSKERTLSGLPAGLRLDSVEPTRDGLELGITGTDVNLAG